MKEQVITMSEPVPEPSAPGFIGHILDRVRAWFEKDVAPELESVKADGERFLQFAEAHSANLQSMANVVMEAVKLLAPADAPAAAALITEAEKVVAEAERIAKEITGNA